MRGYQKTMTARENILCTELSLHVVFGSFCLFTMSPILSLVLVYTHIHTALKDDKEQ